MERSELSPDSDTDEGKVVEISEEEHLQEDVAPHVPTKGGTDTVNNQLQDVALDCTYTRGI